MAQNLSAKFGIKDPRNISINQQILATSNQLFHLTITNFNYDARRTTSHSRVKKIGQEEGSPFQEQMVNEALYITGYGAITMSSAVTGINPAKYGLKGTKQPVLMYL